MEPSLLPVGISFFTFKLISYQIDNFRGEIEKEPGFVDMAAYISMFPQIVSDGVLRLQVLVSTL